MSTLQQETFEQGKNELKAGRPNAAIERFSKLLNGHHTAPEVYHQLGICYRLEDNRGEADRMFALAYVRSENPVLKGQILRDWAMVYFDQNPPDRARCKLEQSLQVLAYNEVDDAKLNREIRAQKNIEYFISLGFWARYQASIGNKETARAFYQVVDTQLRRTSFSEPNNPYELNNLVWWMKVAPPARRFLLGMRALKLAYQAKNKVRLAEVLVLLFAPSIAPKIRSLFVRK